MSIPLPDPAQISQLAQDVTTILSPYLPALLAAGSEMTKGALNKLGEIGIEGIWNTLRPKTETNPNLKRAMERVAARPDDARVKGALEAEIEDVLHDDPALAAQMSVIVGNININNTNITQNVMQSGAVIKGGTIKSRRDVNIGDVNKRDDIYAEGNIVIVQKGGSDQINTEDLVSTFLRTLATECAQLPLGVAMDVEFKSHAGEGAVRTPDIYVPLKVVSGASQEETLKRRMIQDSTESRQHEAVDLVDTLSDPSMTRIVLLGEMGSGKSTFIDYITYILCQIRLGSSNFENPLETESVLTGLLPIRLVLRRVAHAIPGDTKQGQAKFVWDALYANVASRFGSQTGERIYQELENRILHDPTLLLLDGLDEVRESGEVRQRLIESIRDFGQLLLPTSRVIVTARPYAYTEKWHLASFQTLKIAPFDPGQVNEFVRRFYNVARPIMGWDQPTMESKTTELQLGLERPDLADLATRPLLLTMMATLGSTRGKLPDDRFDLYDSIVDMLLSHWQRQRTEQNPDGTWRTDPPIAIALGTDPKTIRQALNKLAFGVHDRQGKQTLAESEVANQNGEPADITDGEVLSAFASVIKGQDPTLFLQYLHDRAGLLLDRGEGVYAFPHRSFQEYLAAWHIMSQADAAQALRHATSKTPQWWRQVFLWSVGINRSVPQNVVRLLADFVPPLRAPHPIAEIVGLPVLFAAMAYDELLVSQHDRLAGYHVFDQLTANLTEWLVPLIEASDLIATDRVQAGRVLAKLGDPRPGIHVPPLLSGQEPNAGASILRHLLWCQIPAGPFWMGSSKNVKDKHYDPQATEWELGQTEKYKKFAKPLYISRYPITNAQFEAFLEAEGGFENPDWWKGLARTDNTEPPPKEGGVFDLPNHPVIRVTWYQAVAFSRWLNKSLSGGDLQIWTRDGIRTAHASSLFSGASSTTVRLPTEAEWEKAARGPNGRKYPWDGAITSEHANYSDTGIGATSAVGSFPKGMSEYGVLDASGNVWEWTLTKWTENYSDYDRQEDYALESESFRVVRGGAFNLALRYVRCASRVSDYPDRRFMYPGFRMVVAPV